MKCKKCDRDYHHCSSCGVEWWHYTYCSEPCLEADGKEVCKSCHGWGPIGDCEDHEDCEGFVDVDALCSLEQAVQILEDIQTRRRTIEADLGLAGDRCEVGNNCGRLGCPECQQ